ncbi:hypothetical protein CERSUDRAFT_43089, partial [Gelatoporia subvermispora B]
TGMFALYFPRLYRYYRVTIRDLERTFDIKQPFLDCQFTGTTANYRPRVVTPMHLDEINLVFGVCAIFVRGQSNHHEGEHLFLILEIVVEFPAGTIATILIPDGNAAIESTA